MIHFSVPGLPLSSNHAYFNRGKIRILTTKGQKYKNETISYLVQTYRRELMMFKSNTRYMFVFKFWCESIENKLWKPNGKVNRYKKFDGGNLTKLLEDCIAEAGGFDDSQTMVSTWMKKQGTPERTEVWAWNLDEESDPFDLDFMLQHLRS